MFIENLITPDEMSAIHYTATFAFAVGEGKKIDTKPAHRDAAFVYYKALE